jgi:exosortase A-associated hydrolase 2
VLTGEFIDGGRGKVFCTVHAPAARTARAIIVVPAFGEEMNRTRRMLAVTSRALARDGITTINPDLYGTGDSEGRFEDASWETWIEDMRQVRNWIAANGMTLFGLIAVRSGALLAAQLLQRDVDLPLERSVLWQPVVAGATFVKQMLRLRVVASSLNAGVRESADDLRASIRRGNAVYCAGYPLTQGVVEPLSLLDLRTMDMHGFGELRAIEVTGLVDAVTDDKWLLGGREVARSRISGEPYWSSTEIVCDMNVVGLTVDTLRKAACAAS